MDSLENPSPAVESLDHWGAAPSIPARSPEILPAHLVASEPSALAFDPVEVALRHDGWTPEKQRAFIEHLADCGIVKEAAARVGMTERSAHRLRRRPDADGFNRAWNAAVALGVDQLHSTAFERAIAGTVRKRYFQGEVIGEDRIYDNRLLIALLGRLDKMRSGEVDRTIGDWARSMDALEDGLDSPPAEPDENHRSPVWRDDAGEWLTSFAPPEGFNGDQWGTPDEADYCRRLTIQEIEAVAAWQSRLDEQRSRQRDLYFARLKNGKSAVESQST
jgi:hypothetical protein